MRTLGLWRSARRDREFMEELDAHLRMHTEDNIRAGMTAGEARRQAVLKLGGIEPTRERYRDRSGLPLVETFAQDVRFALRLMRRTPGFTAVALLTLALGIGGNTVMFSVANSVLLRPLPYRDPDRLLHVQTVTTAGGTWATSPPDFYEYRAHTRTFEHLAAFYTVPINLTGGQDPEHLQVLVVTSGFFTALGTPPVLGRDFTVDDERFGSHRVVVLSDGFWKRRFGSDRTILGRTVTLNAQPYTVVGVLPPAFSFRNFRTEVFLPMSFEAGDNLNTRNNFFLTMVGRLKPGVTRADAVADLNAMSDAIIAAHPENKGTAVAATPLQDVVVKDVRRPILVLLGAVGFVLLISCANLATLLLARGATRQREVVVRTAIGASRGRIVRQLVTESVLLAAVGAAVGLGVAYFTMGALNLLGPDVLPHAEPIRLDAAVLIFTCACAGLSALLFGILPALQTSRADLNSALREDARTSSDGGGRRRLRHALVVVEVALSLVLLIGAGLMAKSLKRLATVDTGFNSDGVLTMLVNLPYRKYVDAQLERRFSPLAYVRSTAFFTELIDRVRRVPGVRAAGAINSLPLMGEVWGKSVTLFDRPLPKDFKDLPPIQYRVVAGDYFRALGIRVVSGRPFVDTDTQSAPKVAIVNRALVRRDWNGQDPIGKIISVNPPLELLPEALVAEARQAGLPDNFQPDKFTIVGVVDDVRYGQLSAPAVPVVYTPYAQGSEGATDMYLAVWTDADPLSVVSPIREQIRQIDPDLPIGNITTLADRVADSLSRPRLQTTVLSAFALIALLLAVVGVYGVMSYVVVERRREIGIRMALGAGRRDVLSLVLTRGLIVMTVGLVLGFAGALAITRVMRSLLFEVSTTDPVVFAAILAVLALTGCLAAYLPARRATAIDPVLTLRAE
jgi:putative ABC transport system permease protein